MFNMVMIGYWIVTQAQNPDGRGAGEIAAFWLGQAAGVFMTYRGFASGSLAVWEFVSRAEPATGTALLVAASTATVVYGAAGAVLYAGQGIAANA